MIQNCGCLNRSTSQLPHFFCITWNFRSSREEAVVEAANLFFRPSYPNHFPIRFSSASIASIFISTFPRKRGRAVTTLLQTSLTRRKREKLVVLRTVVTRAHAFLLFPSANMCNLSSSICHNSGVGLVSLSSQPLLLFAIRHSRLELKMKPWKNTDFLVSKFQMQFDVFSVISNVFILRFSFNFHPQRLHFISFVSRPWSIEAGGCVATQPFPQTGAQLLSFYDPIKQHACGPSVPCSFPNPTLS